MNTVFPHQFTLRPDPLKGSCRMKKMEIMQKIVPESKAALRI